ncbi:MAG TPA: hypothetical protein VH765_10825, partial [Xanthobacteraceae bacterium]
MDDFPSERTRGVFSSRYQLYLSESFDSVLAVGVLKTLAPPGVIRGGSGDLTVNTPGLSCGPVVAPPGNPATPAPVCTNPPMMPTVNS